MKKRVLICIFTFIIVGIGNVGHGFGFAKHKRVPITVTQAVKQYTLDDYMKDMERQIKSNWQPPQNSFKNKTIVNFQILKDGTIKNSKISQTSGDPEFDKGAMLALINTKKLPPLPNNILGESIDISFTFERFSYLVHKDRYDR